MYYLLASKLYYRLVSAQYNDEFQLGIIPSKIKTTDVGEGKFQLLESLTRKIILSPNLKNNCLTFSQRFPFLKESPIADITYNIAKTSFIFPSLLSKSSTNQQKQLSGEELFKRKRIPVDLFWKIKTKLPEDTLLVPSDTKSHGADEMILLKTIDKEYFLMFQDKNIFGTALTPSDVDREALKSCKILESSSPSPSAYGILVMVPTLIGAHLQNSLHYNTTNGYIYLRQNTYYGNNKYTVPNNLDIIILLKPQLENFLGACNLDLLQYLAENKVPPLTRLESSEIFSIPVKTHNGKKKISIIVEKIKGMIADVEIFLPKSETQRSLQLLKTTITSANETLGALQIELITKVQGERATAITTDEHVQNLKEGDVLRIYIKSLAG